MARQSTVNDDDWVKVWLHITKSLSTDLVSQLLFYLQMKEENEQQKKDSTKCLILHNKEKACTKNDIFFLRN